VLLEDGKPIGVTMFIYFVLAAAFGMCEGARLRPLVG
jgi:hypothetical protein